MRRPRDLTEEELALWQYVTRNVTPAFGRRSSAARHPQPEAPPPPPPEAAAGPPPPPRRSLPQQPLQLGASDGIDRRTAQKFARGALAITNRLDLHGLSLRDAQAAVSGFVKRSHAAGDRCVIIVTGKDRTAHPGGEGRGRIRREALHWLEHPSLRPLILAVREAQPMHGGSGALYVLLRRQRTA
jgi:DNA-nicking Smr family endonuclease